MDLRFILMLFFCLPASAQLITRAQLIPLSNSVANLNGATNGLTTRVNNLDGSTNAIDALVRTKQHGTPLLTNWQGTGVLTNIVNGSTNFPAGQVGLLGPTNNGDVRIKSISQGSNITITDQGTNVAISGNITNALVQTNGVNVGSIGTVNFIGATGAVISGVATIGGFGGSSMTTNFVTTAHGTATITNGLYMGAVGNNGTIWGWDDLDSTYRRMLKAEDDTVVYGNSLSANFFYGYNNVFLASLHGDTDVAYEIGEDVSRFEKIWLGPNGLLGGRISLTNKPGEGLPYIELRSTNATSYTKFSRLNDVWKPTNYFKLSVTNPTAGQVLKISSVSYSAGEASVILTNDTDQTGGAGSSVFNINQFSASGTHTNIKDGALFTNVVNYAMTNLGAFSNSGPAFLGGFLDAKGPNTNRVQLNLPHLTASRSAVINAQGDVTNSSAASNWSLYDTNLLFGAAGNSGMVQFNEGGALAATNKFVFDRTNNVLYVSNLNLSAAVSVRSPNLNYTNNIYADGFSTPRNLMNLFLLETTHATDTAYYQFATNAMFYNASNNTALGGWNTPWNTNFANRVQAKEGVSWGNDGAAYYTLEATNAVKTTNIFRFSVTNPVAGQVLKFHNVQNLSGGQVITVVTNDSDNSGGAGAGILTNANQFGAAAATVTIKDYPYLTNVTEWATSRVDSIIITNKALVRAGQSTSNANVGGIMWFDTGNYTNCCGGAVLTNMNQFTVPAHTLTNNGDSLRWWIAGRTAFALASTNEIAVIFGSQAVMDTGLQIRSNCQWTATGTITRTGNTSQRIESTLWWPGPGAASIITNIVTDIAQTNGIDTVLKVRGASRRIAVLTNMLFKVAYEPASL